MLCLAICIVSLLYNAVPIHSIFLPSINHDDAHFVDGTYIVYGSGTIERNLPIPESYSHSGMVISILVYKDGDSTSRQLKNHSIPPSTSLKNVLFNVVVHFPTRKIYVANPLQHVRLIMLTMPVMDQPRISH
jgi:hypothetical protein